MRKKNIRVYFFFLCFLVAGNVKKKFIKKKKTVGAEIWNVYCPNRIVREGLEWQGLYCNTSIVL